MSTNNRKRSNQNKAKAGSKPAPSGSWKPVFAGSPSLQKAKVDDDDEDDDELFDENKYCVVCAEKIVYAAKSPCNHTTCHICSFRQRALYEKKACLVCRTENDDLIFTESKDSSYLELQSSIIATNVKYSASFTSIDAQNNTLSLLNFACVDCSVFVGSNFTNLSEHLKSVHDKYLCSLCSSHKKAFPFELNIYTQKQLQTHLIRGDENDENFNGHPICKFCKGKRFYSADELNMHYRKNHEECHVCKTIDSQNPQYFKNYESLEEHFRTDHYICTVQSCLDRKFVVFADELDLQAHLITDHPTLFGSNYVIGSNKSASSSSRFHSQLSTVTPGAKKQPINEEASDSLQTKKMRLEERARHYANYDTIKFQLFKELNSSFNNGYISSDELKESYTKLFENNSDEEINHLLFDLCETLNKNTTKYQDLSSMVSTQKRILEHKDNDKFPALSANSSSVSLSSGWGANTTVKTKKGRNLDDFPPLAPPPKPKVAPLKKPTTKPTSSWANVSKKPAKSAFPPLPTAKPSKPVVKPSPAVRIPNYLDPKPTSSSSSSSSSLSSSIKPKATLSQDLFPALASQPKKVIPRVNPIPKGNGSWDNGPLTEASAFEMAVMESALTNGNGSNASSKKNKKKKQILFQSGGRI